MAARDPSLEATLLTTLQTLRPKVPSRDASGFAIFSEGETGAAHDMAHRMLDEGRYRTGYERLGAWLAGRDGAGSEWVHLQWHMGVFEIAVGRWESALARFEREILPVATTTEDALTDAPSMLWRLSLAAAGPVDLPWEPVRATALERMKRPSDPYVELHNLLALAGAGDVESLDRWLLRPVAKEPDRRDRLVVRMGVALRAYAAGDHQHAGWVLAGLVPDLNEVGGSRAQNLLFADIERAGWAQASGGASSFLYEKVA